MRSRLLILSLAALALILSLAAACGGGDDDTTATPTASEGESATPTAKPVGVSDLAHAVVQIRAVLDGEPVWHGSGTIISEDGFILTNAHVVDDRGGEYDELHVALTDRTDQAPEEKYLAEIQTVDYAIDLAVIKITETLDGDEVTETFPFVQLGDSDQVEIGDDLQILGYPGIGGETITFTRGAVSGFTSEHSVGDRAWIKTDATIAGGNSGGLAVNRDGQLIGVPSIAGSGAEGSTVDCRFLEDTNGDGFIDSDDSCVPVGGFINGLRPVNLALSLIDDAENGTEYVSPYGGQEAQETPSGGSFDTSAVSLSNIIFSRDVTADDEPTEVIVSLPSDSPSLCAFWDYEGMQDGMSYDANWYVDGELSEGYSFIGDTWSGGESGTWWVCADNGNGLVDGTYELLLQVEGEPQGASAIYVGDEHQPVDLEVINDSEVEICIVAISPTEAMNWGSDKLGQNVTLAPGDSHTITIASGVYDILARDCDRNDVVIEGDVSIETDSTYTIS
jgi:S1-C subfamily serine protease